MTALAKKLFIKPGHRVALVGAPKGTAALLAPLPEGAAARPGVGRPPYDLVLGFVRRRKDAVALAKRLVAATGALWLAYPKLAAGEPGDLRRDILWQAVQPTGWQGVSLVAVDGVWSAMRFKRVAPGKPRAARTSRR